MLSPDLTSFALLSAQAAGAFVFPLSSPKGLVRAQHVMIGRSFVMLMLTCD
jgi:hypothetical protein